MEAGLSALHGALLCFAATCQAKPREKVRARSTGALERALGPKGTVRASTVAIGTERSRATGTGVGDSTPRSGKSLSCAPQQMHVRLHLGCATLVGPIGHVRLQVIAATRVQLRGVNLTVTKVRLAFHVQPWSARSR